MTTVGLRKSLRISVVSYFLSRQKSSSCQSHRRLAKLPPPVILPGRREPPEQGRSGPTRGVRAPLATKEGPVMAAKDSPRPLIGINTDFFAATKTYTAHARVNAGYFDAVLAAGGLPILLPPVGKEAELDALLDRVDGVLLTGGLDMDPRRDGQALTASIQL